MTEDIRRVVAAINHQHDMNWELGKRCTGGLQGGAWELCEPDERRRAILKCSTRPRFYTHRRAAAIAAIRAAGYPTPAWLAVGRTDSDSYLVQEFVAGQPPGFTVDTARQLIDIIELQAGLAPDLDQDWSTYVASDNGEREYVHRVAPALVRQFDRITTEVEIPGGDMVHGDFNTCNVLAVDRRVTGVIDADAFGHGTRAIDYAWLLREAFADGTDRAAADLVRKAGEAVAGPAVFARCTAHTALDIVRWVHSRKPESAAPLIDRMHNLADYLAT